MYKQGRRIRNDANTTYNVINVAGTSNKYEQVLQDIPTHVTPGCALIPYQGTPTSATSGYDGAMGFVTTPKTPITGNVKVRVLDIGGVSGLAITDEFEELDQVPTLSNESGAHWNVRIASTETVVEGQFLTITTNGSGLFTATGATAANAVGIACEPLVVTDTSWPSYIKMEVL